MSKKQPLITESFPQQKLPATRSSKRLENKAYNNGDVNNVAADQHQTAFNAVSNSAPRSNADILREAELNILRKFDVRMDYGPCTGITRMERWERADRNGLNPPDKIKQIILKHENDTEYTNNLWHDYPL
ncbi:DNA polymerase delta subunit 4-like [Amphiura filiformis]|uniref:DNA polymerase delta subunit 4-like n=1 Tax=Amphiura filiformis TaxID=82378 RepID=UPI003B21CDF2